MPRKRPGVDRDKEQFWRKTIARQASSGLSQNAFCRREKLNPNTLSWWKREIASRDADSGDSATGGARSAPAIFVPVAEVQNTVRVTHAPVPVAEIDLASRLVRVYAGIDRHSLYEMLAALREVAF